MHETSDSPRQAPGCNRRSRLTTSAALSLLLVLLLAALAGCNGASAPEATTDDSDTTPDAAADTATPPEGYDAIPADGPGEAAALAAVPGALDEARRTAAGSLPDVTGLGPTLTAYLVAVDMGDQTTLFEVRADGIAHSLYAYQRAFDSAALLWTPLDASGGTRVAPRSAGETSAVAAVDAAMRDAFPEEQLAVGIYGYRFVYLDKGIPVLSLEIAPDGTVISVSQ